MGNRLRSGVRANLVTEKTVGSTRTVLGQLIEPGDANYLGKAFGGAILSKIDLCAYATATRFAGTICVTASFDRVDFHQPIEVGELVQLEGRVSFAGRTSVEVTIEISSQNVVTGEVRHTNTARVTMVAMRDGQKAEVPKLIPESREEKIDYLEARLRREAREKLRSERKELKGQLIRLTDDQIEEWMRAEKMDILLGQS
ncbi:MAG: acyl-CoA thioesterase [Armatimonadota bacterium]